MSNPDPNAQDRGECPNCGDLMRMIPAGVSRKTGKPYRAFPVCDNPPCKAIKNQSRPNTYSAPQSPSQGSFNPLQAIVEDHQRKIDELNQAISNIRTWAIKTEKEIQGLQSLAAFVESKQATELHSSFPPIDVKEPSKKFEFDLGKVKETLQDPKNSGVNIEMPKGGL